MWNKILPNLYSALIYKNKISTFLSLFIHSISFQEMRQIFFASPLSQHENYSIFLKNN